MHQEPQTKHFRRKKDVEKHQRDIRLRIKQDLQIFFRPSPGKH